MGTARMTGLTPRDQWFAPGISAAVGSGLFLLTPAAASSPLGAWPLTPLGTLTFAAAIGLGVLAWRLSLPPSGRWIAVAMASLIVVRAATSVMATDTGWLARYYANDTWQGQPAWSSEFRFADATRIDPSLSLQDDFPLHYLNGPEYSSAPPDRATAVPMSALWTGVFGLETPETLSIALQSRGRASMYIDEAAVLVTEDRATREIALDAGEHRVEIKYRKPEGVDPSLVVELRRAGSNSPVDVFPFVPAARRPFVDLVAAGADVTMLVLLFGAAAHTLAHMLRSEQRLQSALGTAMAVALTVQGFIVAQPFRKFVSLTGGDDWFGFESRARNILQHGVLMPLDAAIGQGVPYFYHPFYPYVLAGIHALTGESLFGPIFAHFVLLAATAIVMYALVASLFRRWPAIAGIAALVAIFELDFIRYYTITLLSENLYVLTVTCCLFAFARWAGTGRTAWLVGAGVWGGISAATRPVMMVFLPFAIVACWMIARQARRPGAAVSPLVLTASWMACVLPFTLRNWIVSKQFVLISAGQGGAVIAHNVPQPIDPEPYLAAYRSGGESSIGVLWRLFIEHPVDVIALQIKKLGFTLGMIHWFEGYRPHPELLAVSALYLLMLVMSRTMRRPELWPMHAFVFSHWGSMMLTSPWNYGYRLILPAYVYTTALSVAAAAAALHMRRAV